MDEVLEAYGSSINAVDVEDCLQVRGETDCPEIRVDEESIPPSTSGQKQILFAQGPLGTLPFKDVYSNTPHYDDIYWLYTALVTTGYSNGTFRPANSVTRQDMAAFLFRVAKLQGLVTESWSASSAQKRAFKDVSASTPHSREIWWLASVSISTGYGDGTFRPTNSVTRQDMAAFIFRLAKLAGKGSATNSWSPTNAQRGAFPDVTSSTPHSREIWWLASARITMGYGDGTFRPARSVTRQDMAAFLHRVFDLFSGSSKVGLYRLETAYGASWSPQPAYYLGVESQSGNSIAFWIERWGANGSPVYTTSDIRVALNGGKASFSWTDSWSNSGTGTLVFSGSFVEVTMVVTKAASWNRSTLATGNGGLTLIKVSNVIGSKPFGQ